MFGRGGEEVARLREHNIPVVIVPGITAALGCAAEAELPLTLRNEATRLSFVTAHRADEAEAVDWSGPHRQADDGGGLHGPCLRGGGARRARQRRAAIRRRRRRCWRAARGPDSRATVGRLDELPKLAAAVGEGPALLVIGEVVAHSAPWREALEFLNAQVAA